MSRAQGLALGVAIVLALLIGVAYTRYPQGGAVEGTKAATEQTTTRQSDQRSAPAAVPTTQPVPAAATNLNAEGHPGPTTGEAKQILALDVQRLDTETAAFVVRDPKGQTSTANCPSGWTCTVTEPSGAVKVYQGMDGLQVQLTAATFRFIAGYPQGDAVHESPPCELARKEQAFGQRENPSFGVTAGNFSCTTATGQQTQAQTSASTCPTGQQQWTDVLGGNPGNWNVISGAQAVYKGSVQLKQVPNGFVVHYDAGGRQGEARGGSTPPQGSVFTAYCER